MRESAIVQLYNTDQVNEMKWYMLYTRPTCRAGL